MIGAVSFNDSRGSYQASSWRPAPPLLCKIAKWKTVGFVFIDEFDAFYHYELSESVQKRLRRISDVQVFTTTHNTDLMSNDLLRPDCYFLLENNSINAISELTEKELRQAHNLQKMYKAGAFNGR